MTKRPKITLNRYLKRKRERDEAETSEREVRQFEAGLHLIHDTFRESVCSVRPMQSGRVVIELDLSPLASEAQKHPEIAVFLQDHKTAPRDSTTRSISDGDETVDSS
jgi:hypothetical protein